MQNSLLCYFEKALLAKTRATALKDFKVRSRQWKSCGWREAIIAPLDTETLLQKPGKSGAATCYPPRKANAPGEEIDLGFQGMH